LIYSAIREYYYKLKMKDIDLCFDRIYRLLGTDEGFYTLSLHSFIEYYIDQALPEARYIYNFPEKIDLLQNVLHENPPDIKDWNKVLVRICKDHNVTNKIRHSFHDISSDEAIAMTYNFLGFCRIAGIKTDTKLSALENDIKKAWDEKIVPLKQLNALKSLEFRVLLDSRKYSDFESKLKEFQASEAAALNLSQQIKKLEIELTEKTKIAENRKEKNDENRIAQHKLSQELKEARKKLEELQPVKEHFDNLVRLSNYSRTRRDYERTIIKLTPEQAEVLKSINFKNDFLVKGSAGTGKTIVLLKAFKEIIEKSDSQNNRAVLLTYTRTLVRYNQYLADIMDRHGLHGIIMTSESFFVNKLKNVNNDYEISYEIIEKLTARYNTTGFLSDRELATEIEDFLFANNISEEEYIDKRIPRRGLKIPLNNNQRIKVWQTAQKIISDMEGLKIFSKNYSRIKILEYLSDNDNHPGIQEIDNIFVDEAQDLCAVELMTLKAISGKPLIMAGDSDQSIYGFSSPYARAGIHLAGRSRTLKINFRNTAAIHQFSEIYRSISVSVEYDSDQVSMAFREGPVPELIEESSPDLLLKQIIDKISFFIEQLGYDPENICILAPSVNEINKIIIHLAQNNYQAVDIREPSFDFSMEKIIRLSTLHSSKGVDFPVVMIYLPSLPPMKDVDETSLNKLYHNLIYVAATRAMDHLIIGITKNIKNEAVRDLKTAYEYLVESMKTEYPS